MFTPAVGLAESLRMELPEHRVLSSSETESFEAALAEQLGVELGRPVQFGVPEGQVGVRVEARQQRGVTTYYRAVPAALVPTDAGPAAWAELRDQSVCVSTASPYAQVLRERFGASPREYPSSAHALIGLKLGECQAVVEDEALLTELATLPEWRRYKRLLPPLADAERQLRLTADGAGLQQEIDALVAQWSVDGRLAKLTQKWIDEVAFQAYVLADTLDCH
nr:transporter substrate-binding domain-containing protein [Stutzerimonas stutzeri]